MFLDLGPETHKDGPATGCEGGCGARVFLILPQTPGHGTTQHTHSLRRVIENAPTMLQRDGENTCILTSAIHSFTNTTTRPNPSVVSHLGAAQTQGLMNLF